MRNFLFRGLLFGCPFVFYALIVLILDPFGYYRDDIPFAHETHQISEAVNPHLYRILRFEKKPRTNIMLGDSRSVDLYQSFPDNKPNYQNWALLSYEGSSLRELIDTFWWAESMTDLDTVLFGIHLNQFNDHKAKTWVSDAFQKSDSFFSYAFSQPVFRSIYHLFKGLLFSGEFTLGQPNMSRNEFWEYQLLTKPKRLYSNLIYPVNYIKELQGISDFCDQNHIVLMFWTPPTHISYQRKKEEFKLEKVDSLMKKQLVEWGDLYDFDLTSPISIDSSNYSDPLHFKEQISILIIDDLFGAVNQYSKYTHRNDGLRE